MKKFIIKIIIKLLVTVQIILFYFIKIINRENRNKKSLYKRILIIKLWAIGEVVLSTPIAKTVKENYPDSFITFLVGKKSENILENNIYIDKIISIDEKLFLNFKIFKIIDLIKNIREMNFDILINVHHSILFSIFSLFLSIPTRVGFNRSGEGITNTIKVKPQPNKHKIDEYLSLTEAMGMKISDKKPAVFLTDKDIVLAKKFLIKNNIRKDKLLIGMMPTGSSDIASKKLSIDMRRKVWDIEYYIRLAQILISKMNAQIIFFGGKQELKFKDKIYDNLKNNIIDSIGKLSLKEMGAVAKKCKFVVTNDSGPMHLLWSLDIPIIVIFGPTDPNICGQKKKKSIVIKSDLPCSPCFKYDKFPNFFQKCDNIKCMKDITPEKVWGQISTLTLNNKI